VGMEREFDVHPKWIEQETRESLSMGMSAEHVARTFKISRREQDEYAVRSHRRAASAQAAGAFRKEIVPIHTTGHRDRPVVIEHDQCVRPDTTIEQLAELQPAFQPVTGTVTAGNSSPLSDGAAAVLMMSRERAAELGLKPLARVVATSVVGVEPRLFGTGPVPATRRALQKAGLTLGDIELVELNEAFSAQALACARQLDIPDEKLNVRGGSLAIGHPLGASGARITTTLLHNMVDRDATLGLAAMCIGLGQGIATILERLN
jgi:acetyl-CoA acyltransferase